ncbi:GlxA family transcriptional regulator [Paraburkholderia dinghuensis]|uniref:Helix-turn-helix domain-containing protein n=1 Tax=Paraburkholderia dinghuensis TaxID=2305225 RepID=A0A3N6N070_9BURK|nr:helix-turn-helix domain-containing protein [Paraburkholderia dinghuensis]RQH02202.1 helix-turn-helix domain-containing protein [Paraburkholderia dinghuensis]
MTYAAFEDRDLPATLSAKKFAPGLARQVGLVLFDGFSLLGTGMVAEVLQLANEIAAADDGGEPTYRVWLLSVRGGGIACSSSLELATIAIDAASQLHFDAVYIGGGRSAMQALEDIRLIAWLRRVVATTTEVRAIGHGQRLLEAAGIETARVVPEPPTHVASTADDTPGDDHHEALKSALMMIRRDLGVEIARKVGERALPSISTRLSALFADATRATPADKVWASARWLEENCERPISVGDAAQTFAMSERNYLRCFKLELGVTPSDYLLQVRLELTCQLLVNTDLPVDKVARRCGMRDGDRLSKIFRNRLGVSPTEYRNRHRVHADNVIGQ